MGILRGKIGSVLLLGAFCVLFAWGICGEAKAELVDSSQLQIGTNYVMKRKELIQDIFLDGKGGRAVYDINTNTLTLTNFTLETNEVSSAICASNMGRDFKIVLNGDNELKAKECSIDILQNGNIISDCIIQGRGSLKAFGYIHIQNNLLIDNCAIDIESDFFGIGGSDRNNVTIKNSDVRINIIDDNLPSVRASGIEGNSLTVENSNISISVPKAQEHSYHVDPYYPQAIFTKQPMQADLDDISITNAQGEKLKQVNFYWSTDLGWWKAYVKEDIPWNDDDPVLERYTKLTTTIEIKSKTRAQENANVNHVIKLINEIGMVTNQSGDQIRAARAAYEALSDELKARITNISVLTEAEKAYETASQEAANKVIELINAIGNVDISSEEKIKQAQEAYDKLPEDQKSKVTNVDILNTAQKSYQQAVAKAAEEKRIEEEKKKEEEERKRIEEEKKKAEEERKKSENQPQTGTEDPKVTGENKKDNKTTSNVTVKKTKITYLKSIKKKQLTVKWVKDKTCKGYQIAYSTNKKFKNAKFKVIKKWKTNKITIKNVKSKKYYYVRIREYKVVKGKKVFGNWCKVKKVKVR